MRALQLRGSVAIEAQGIILLLQYDNLLIAATDVHVPAGRLLPSMHLMGLESRYLGLKG